MELKKFCKISRGFKICSSWGVALTIFKITLDETLFSKWSQTLRFPTFGMISRFFFFSNHFKVIYYIKLEAIAIF